MTIAFRRKGTSFFILHCDKEAVGGWEQCKTSSLLYQKVHHPFLRLIDEMPEPSHRREWRLLSRAILHRTQEWKQRFSLNRCSCPTQRLAPPDVCLHCGAVFMYTTYEAVGPCCKIRLDKCLCSQDSMVSPMVATTDASATEHRRGRLHVYHRFQLCQIITAQIIRLLL